MNEYQKICEEQERYLSLMGKTKDSSEKEELRKKAKLCALKKTAIREKIIKNK